MSVKNQARLFSELTILFFKMDNSTARLNNRIVRFNNNKTASSLNYVAVFQATCSRLVLTLALGDPYQPTI